MSYDVVTLDTNIFSNSHYDLEHGLLAQLSQFKEGSARLVLSEVVHSELKRHLISATATKRQRLMTLAREAKDSGLISDTEAQQLTTICNRAVSAEEAVTSRLGNFATVTGLEIVNAAATNIQELLQRYFAISPPFESSGPKKKEFPDAIALMSLEAWAKAANLKVLAISKDAGWLAYANSSTHIDVQEDLATALSTFQVLHAQARTFVEALLQAAYSGRAPTLEYTIKEELTGIVQELNDVEAVAESRESFKAGQVNLRLLHAQLMARDGTTHFTVVRTGANRIVFTVLSMLTVSASASFTFQGWEDDQGPYDYEDSDEEVEDWFETDLLFDLDTSGIFPRITNIELLNPPEEIDFGTIESMAASDARYE